MSIKSNLKWPSLLLVLLMVISSQAIANEQSTSLGWHKMSWQQQKIIREYRYLITKNNVEPKPLVILLHGGTQNMHKIFAKHAGGSKQWPILAKKHGFVLLTPNGTSPKTGSGQGKKLNWNDCRSSHPKDRYHVVADDVAFIRHLVDWSITNLAVDPKQVFVVGASNGGMMSYRLAAELPNKITAVAAFIANLPQQSECKKAQTPIPLFIFNSNKDPFMPWGGGEIKSNGGQVISAQQTLDYWLAVNQSSTVAQAEVFRDLNTKDHSRVSGKCYPKKSANSAKTCFYQALGSGHVTPSIAHKIPYWIQKRIIGWQNYDVESADMAWDFFQSIEAIRTTGAQTKKNR